MVGKMAKAGAVRGVGRQVERDYEQIRQDCALVTATDATHAPYLFNAIGAIRDRFPSHPKLCVFDLGMSWAQRRELFGIPWLEVRNIERFVGHWHRNWSWKPYILTRVEQRYVLYFDAANIVLYRPLHLWFAAIRRHGYMLIENGQELQDITPTDYWSMFGLDPGACGRQPAFGAGLFGFDRMSPAGAAVQEALSRTKEGWSLGCSAGEERRIYDRSVVRHCPCFRADQTLFNLAFRKQFGLTLTVRDELRYCGRGGPHDHPRQYLWYARRKRSSLRYFWIPLKSASPIYWLNRASAYLWIAARDHAHKLRALWLQRRIGSLGRRQ